MLDGDTKRRIDSARDILVGKVPDPKAQVEQITIALIYKFMNDMDSQARELAGKESFFIRGLKKYSWNNLLNGKLSGRERYDLYVKAIEQIPNSEHIPSLFGAVFRGAFVPYRDFRTFYLFLKEIDYFTYDNSENLGNAYEYLLSVLGSQGDAGQFRTPRHIIDFIVAITDPKKNETILDPACGTAGFLISAYKYILKHNSSNSKSAGAKETSGRTAAEASFTTKTYSGDQLKISERKSLVRNFVGYDISPDMVKLSLVNMYLHRFSQPRIHEYDTLTSEERWNDQFDVILANPPFMSPKGGIRPHKRFSVQAKRSEVLFVDYIMEHLSLKGRAGIIVPEGIIFQTQNAYQQLRKMLIENGLFAVISLPPGVFNPYSGVKTSILLLDKQFAPKRDELLFVKINDDGFDLGAQRRQIDRNDLPEALEVIAKWKQGKKKKSQLALWVKKEKIATSDDYNLIGERYREIEIHKNQKWPEIELGEILNYEQPTKYVVKSINYKDEYKTPVLTPGKTFILGYTNETKGIYSKEKLPVIIFDDFTTASRLVDFPFKVKSSAMKILSTKNKNKTDIKFVFFAMQDIKFDASRHKRYWIAEYSKQRIPLPPLEVQQEIIQQIEIKQDAINHAKEVIKNLERERRYFGQTLRKLEGVEWVELGNANFFKIESGSTPNTRKADYWNGDINWATLVDLPQENYITELISTKRKITEQGLSKLPAGLLPVDTVLVSSRATIGRVAIAKNPIVTNQGFKNIIIKNKRRILPYFVAMCMTAKVDEMIQIATGGTFKEITKSKFEKLKIPLPPLETQKQLVAEAEKEEEIIASNRRLIELMEQKIAKVLLDI